MTTDLIGTHVRLRFFSPGDIISISGIGIGTIVEQVPESGPVQFHDAYTIKLERSIRIEDSEFDEVYAVPTGPYIQGEDKMRNLLDKSVYTTVCWRLPDGQSETCGEKGTFAEVSLLK
jgi:hypothetical protein